MDSTVLKIVQIFVSAPHLLLANMNSSVALQDAAPSPQFDTHASAHAPLLTRLSLLRQGEKVYQLDDYLVLELSLSWSKSTQWYSQRSR